MGKRPKREVSTLMEERQSGASRCKPLDSAKVDARGRMHADQRYRSTHPAAFYVQEPMRWSYAKYSLSWEQDPVNIADLIPRYTGPQWQNCVFNPSRTLSR